MEPLPEHLGHKPIFSIAYEAYDGMYAGQTDVRYLSIGLAQYDQSKVSVKTMRYVGDRWSRQAEELPAHRIVDMTLFLAMALTADEGVFGIDAGTFDNQNSNLTVVKNRNRSEMEKSLFEDFLEEHGEHLKKRLNVLTEVLVKLKEEGKL